jgi:pyruvate formate lyase activating enzyme
MTTQTTAPWVPAAFYRARGDRLLCTLCPHGCLLRDGETGFCRVRRRRGGILETAAFASAVRHLDAVERKPFYHYKPGTRVLTLAAPGCSFTCLYCQNYRLSQFGRHAEAHAATVIVDPEAVVAAARARKVAIALSYSEPSLAAELTLAIGAAGRAQGVELLWKSNGFVAPEALADLIPCLAAVNIDLKAADERRHQALTGAPLQPVLETIGACIAAGVWVEISTPVIPKFNADEDSLRALAARIREWGAWIPWHLLRFSPDFRLRRASSTPPETLAEAVRIARREGLRYVYVERACGPEQRNTQCPDCGYTVISRALWATRTMALVNGGCPNCGSAIPGRWH